MRICKPNEAGLIFGQGGPSMTGFSGGSSVQASVAPTAPTPQPSTPYSPSVGPITPNDPYAPSAPTVTPPSPAVGGYNPGTVTPGLDPQQGPGLNMCPNLGPGPTGPSSQAPGPSADFGPSAEDGGYGGNTGTFA